MKKKLALKREIVSRLTDEQMNRLEGGIDVTYSATCPAGESAGPHFGSGCGNTEGCQTTSCISVCESMECDNDTRVRSCYDCYRVKDSEAGSCPCPVIPY